MNQEIQLRVILLSPPPNVDFGLQKGNGTIYETVQVQRSTTSDLVFDVDVKLKQPAQRSGEPNFIGPYVQGTIPGKFIYIDIGTHTGRKHAAWSRRLKIPLNGISFDMIARVQDDSTLIIKTSVPGTGKDGTPNCATVKPFDGWQLGKKTIQ